jgi:hypothetical protein
MRTHQRQVSFKTISLGNNLKKVRNQLNKLSEPTSTFTNPITILALQQGIGKTHMFTKYAKSHWKKEKIILASPRHNHLGEVSKKLGADKSRHWYGFSHKDKYNIYRGCNKLNKNISILNKLKEKENNNLLSPRYICNLLGCKKNKCRYYITRGKSNKIDLMPIEYLGTDAVLKQNPRIVFIDESIDKIDEYRYDASIISDCIKIANKNKKYTQLATNLKSILPKPKSGSIQNTLLDKIEDDKNNLITEYIKNKNYKDGLKLSNLGSILKYLKYAPSYDSDIYYRPKIYDAFDLAYNHDIKVVFLNASFNDDLFTYFLETYSNKIRNVTIPKYVSNVVNSESILIRAYPENKFWKGAFAHYSIQRTLKDIFKVIRIVEKHIPKEKIGIITYKQSGSRYGNVPIEYQFLKRGYDAIHFWDEAGLNILENKYILFIIGTPWIPTKEIIKIWEKIHDEKVNLKPEDIGGKDDRGYYITDELMQFEFKGELRYIPLLTCHSIYDILDREGIKISNGQHINPWLIWKISKYFNLVNTKSYDFSLIKKQYIDQMIDSIQRCRALTHSRIIIALGDVLGEYPWVARLQRKLLYDLDKDSINRLLGIKQINIEEDELDELDKILKNHKVVGNYKVEAFFKFIIDNEGYVNRASIAKSLKIWKNGNPDVKFIEEIEKIIEDMNGKI